MYAINSSDQIHFDTLWFNRWEVIFNKIVNTWINFPIFWPNNFFYLKHYHDNQKTNQAFKEAADDAAALFTPKMIYNAIIVFIQKASDLCEKQWIS
jgi:hypothetical protein